MGLRESKLKKVPGKDLWLRYPERYLAINQEFDIRANMKNYEKEHKIRKEKERALKQARNNGPETYNEILTREESKEEPDGPEIF